MLGQQGRLSPAGIAEQVRRHAVKHYAGQLAKARKRVEDARAQLQVKRPSLGAPKLDRDDLLAPFNLRVKRVTICCRSASPNGRLC